MTHKENWLEKSFSFDFPTSKYVEYLEFLRQTPSRLYALVESLPNDVLIQREGDSWSIQENVGHILTVESLFTGRLEDYHNDLETLRPARFDDNPTDKADFNTKDIGWILQEFQAQRQAYMDQLGALEAEEFGKVSLHPRLLKPMRICDTLLFHVEHDRHHLRRIEELKDKFHL
ncbi:MAG: DinB family protein [Anaerolineales bacterium]|nr:DinB family protein [Chloroflexota bacterium]MBL6980089.1 DinB family protein [Anaerolineales bacterium]